MVFTIACCALLGSCVGALTPRVAHRLAVPRGRAPRPGCGRCGLAFPAGVAGWFRVGAACVCRSRRAVAHPAPVPPHCVPSEGLVWSADGWGAALAGTLGGGLAAGAVGAAFGPTVELFGFLSLTVLGGLLVAVDLACLRLPDPLVAALLAGGAGPLVTAALLAGQPDRLGRAAAAGALCGTTYLLVGSLPGAPLGFGDVKLGAVLGVLLGWSGWSTVAAGLLLPTLLAGPVAVLLLVTGRATRRTALPFGPALVVGAVVAVVTT